MILENSEIGKKKPKNIKIEELVCKNSFFFQRINGRKYIMIQFGKSKYCKKGGSGW